MFGFFSSAICWYDDVVASATIGTFEPDWVSDCARDCSCCGMICSTTTSAWLEITLLASTDRFSCAPIPSLRTTWPPSALILAASASNSGSVLDDWT
jgi:hypothetical protein